jgi:transcriptional regulator with XRE-family HTH domain
MRCRDPVDIDVFRAVAGALILDARTRAGLTQAELAERAETAQSAIAAHEAGARQPTMPTLYRVLTAAGFDLRARLEPHDPHDDTLAEWEASLPAAQRRQRRHQLEQSRRQASEWQAELR